MANYFAPSGGHPDQTTLLTDRAVFTEAYAVIPKGTMRDIVTSFLPFWEGTRLWVLARPMTGFAETFSQYIMEVQPGGGSQNPEADPKAQGVLFVVEGGFTLTIDGQAHGMSEAAMPISQRGRIGSSSTIPTRSLDSTGCANVTRLWMASTRPTRLSSRKRISPPMRCRALMANGPRPVLSIRKMCAMTCM